MGRKPRVAKAKTSKRVSTVKVGKLSKVKKLKVDKRKKVRGAKVKVSRGKGSKTLLARTTTSVASTVAGPTARNTGNVVRNTLAATRQRVSTLGIRDTNPLG